MTAATPRNIHVDITSDINCPFCLVGTKQLSAAIDKYNQSHPAAPIRPEIRIHPFDVTPGLTTEPVRKRDYMAKKFGPSRVDGLLETFKARLAEVGYQDANVDGLISASHLGHRLQEYVTHHKPEKLLDVALDLFEMHQVKGGHASDRNALAAIAVKNGIFDTEAEAQKWFDTDEYDEEVTKAIASAQRRGVTGVPFFVFQNKWAASGAMGTESFVDLLEDIAQRDTDGSAGDKTGTKESVGVKCQ